MLRGLCTVSFFADDVAAAQRWYADVLGIDAYFVRPEAPQPAQYVEFRVGDYQHELGIIDRRFAAPGAPTKPGGAIAYWHVDDIKTALDRLQSMGATQLEPITERGPGFTTASVVDPFGNVLGLMYNEHYRTVLAEAAANEADPTATSVRSARHPRTAGDPDVR